MNASDCAVGMEEDQPTALPRGRFLRRHGHRLAADGAAQPERSLRLPLLHRHDSHSTFPGFRISRNPRSGPKKGLQEVVLLSVDPKPPRQQRRRRDAGKRGFGKPCK